MSTGLRRQGYVVVFDNEGQVVHRDVVSAETYETSLNSVLTRACMEHELQRPDYSVFVSQEAASGVTGQPASQYRFMSRGIYKKRLQGKGRPGKAEDYATLLD